MRSVLTRVIFRRIIRNEPILHRDFYRVYTPSSRNGQRIPGFPQRRTLFGFARPRTRSRGAEKDPGLSVMIDASKRLQANMRLQESSELVRAWTSLFNAKAANDEPILDAQAAYAHKTFKHLGSLSASDPKASISLKDLETSLKVLAAAPKEGELLGFDEGYATFATDIYDKIESFKDDFVPSGEEPIERRIAAARSHLVKILCASGRSTEAVAILTAESGIGPSTEQDWANVIVGIRLEGSINKLKRTIGVINKQAPSIFPKLQGLLASTLARMGHMDKAKHWYTKATASGSSVSAADIDSIFQACLTHKDPEWGWAIIREVTENGRLKEDRDLWDSLFVWSAHNGKSVDEVDRMMEVMGRTNKTFRPRNQTINSLIAVANARNDSYLAERFLSLGLKWGVKPDALTYLYQIDYRLSVGDVDGAQQAYNQLQGQEVESGEDVPRINRLLQAVCATPKPSFERVMKIVDDLSERHARFEPDTVSALSVLHLKRDEYHDVVDLLQTHVGNYSWEERAKVRDVFVNFCLDRRNPIARVWDTYMIFHQIFDETDRKVRTRIMNEFFTRRRADMAVHVFNHMRQHIRPDTVATLDTYVTALVGIGRLGDAESLDLIHNQLKLDLHVDPNTRLYNALMIGYTGCNDASRAMEFWDDIAGSQEGPTTNSILVMFRACEMASFGEVKAQAIWRQLNELDAEITKEMATEYIGALAGNLMLDEAYNMVQNKLEQEYGFKPDVKILGTLFNATRSRSRQPGVGTWIQSNFPEIWKELEALGSKKNLNDTRNFRIDRTLEP